MARVALVGLGKMGLSHLAILRAHPDVTLAAICDSTSYIVDAVAKGARLPGYHDFGDMLAAESLDAVVIATPSRLHAGMVRAAIERGLHVFCEKPFCLDPVEGETLADRAEQKGLVNQVGYHYRFVGAFRRARDIVQGQVLGRIHHVRAEAYGPVVLRAKSATWRSNRTDGGGCLYDYASHAIDLLHFLFGEPDRVAGTVLNPVFSRDVEDEVYSTCYFRRGMTAQVAANWSDESQRKMSMKLSVWGTNGRMTVDRQEVQLYVREAGVAKIPVKAGWSVAYTTELTQAPFFYLRGEEYSDQIDHFIARIHGRCHDAISSFASATATDRVAAMMVRDATRVPANDQAPPLTPPAARRPGRLRQVFSLLS